MTLVSASTNFLLWRKKLVEQRRFSHQPVQKSGGIPSCFQIYKTGELFYRIPSVWDVGGADGIRTHDPHVANVMLSQLSYCPKFYAY
jgi:hypothetical protein